MFQNIPILFQVSTNGRSSRDAMSMQELKVCKLGSMTGAKARLSEGHTKELAELHHHEECQWNVHSDGYCNIDK